jgi:acyl carrier protein
MTIMERMQPVFRDIFDDVNLQVTRRTTAQDVEGWDSLSHISLVVALEKEFDLKFTLTELKPLKNVGEMEDLIARKLG